MLAAGLPSLAVAQAAVSPAVSVNYLTSLHEFSSDTVTTASGPAGWPGASKPSAPPLWTLHPTLQRGYLYGGFQGRNLNTSNRYDSPSLGTDVLCKDDRTIQGCFSKESTRGLYWLPTVPGVYETEFIYSLSQTSQDLYGRINGTPVLGKDGGLYGVMVNGGAGASAVQGGIVWRAGSDGTHFTSVTKVGDLHSPNGTLVMDAEGNFYGADKGPQGQGRVYKITMNGTGAGATGTVSTVHEFGAGPNGMPQQANGLILGSDGLLYGITGYFRGRSFHPDTPTAPDTPTGTLYRIDPAVPGSVAVLHTFTLAEGEINVSDNVSQARTVSPPGMSWVVEGADGWLYGATTPTCQGVFDPSPTWSSIYVNGYVASSPQCGNRQQPHYYRSGTLSYPYYDGPVPHGAVYRIRKDGTGSLQVLHVFGDTDGSAPRGPLAVGTDGNIYGTTMTGGANRHWEWNQGGQFRLTHPPTCADLDIGVRQAECQAVGAANYGRTQAQPVTDGVLYRIVPASIRVAASGAVEAGGFELLHSFKHDVDGFLPLGLAAGGDGRLYGVSASGGRGFGSQSAGGKWIDGDDKGTVFQVDIQGDTPSAGITLIAESAQLRAGETAVLTWTSHQTKDCRVESSAQDWTGAVAPEGSIQFVARGGTYRYSIVCTDSVKGGEVSSALLTLYVGVPATAEDGNEVSYGNGGGAWSGGLLPLLGLAPLAVARRRRGRPAPLSSRAAGLPSTPGASSIAG